MLVTRLPQMIGSSVVVCILCMTLCKLNAQEPPTCPDSSTDAAATSDRAELIKLITTVDPSDSKLAELSHWPSVVLAHTYLTSNALGIEIAPVDATLAAQLKIDGGLVITKVPEGSEGAKAGLHVHDILLNIAGPQPEPLREAHKFHERLANYAGKSLEIALLRGGKTQIVRITIPELQQFLIDTEARAQFGLELQKQSIAKYRLGVGLAEADDTLRSHLRLEPGFGVVVTEVISGSAAEKAGIKTNDVLLELDNKALKNPDEVTNQIQDVKDRQVELNMIRAGKNMKIMVTPEIDKSAAAGTDAAFLIVQRPETAELWKRFLFTQGANRIITGNGDVDTPIVVDLALLNPAINAHDQINAIKNQLTQVIALVAQLEASLPAKTQATPTATDEKK